jgi:putative Holliday junction resolvase
MRVMGLDMGTKRIGVAMSDERGVTATPLKVLKRSGERKVFEELKKLVEEYSVGSVVVGMPLNMDGSVGPKAKGVEAFIARLGGELQIPVKAWDERLSTVAVTRVLLEADVSRAGRKRVVDKLAAAYILQGYLDTPQGPPQGGV